MTQSPDEEDRRSDEGDAANKSASLTPQNLEAKAREIVAGQLTEGETETWAQFQAREAALIAAILHALREERERAAKIADEYERASRAAYEKIKDIADGTGLLTAANQALVIAALLAATDQAIDIAAAIRGELLSGLDSALRTGEEVKSGVDVAEAAKG